jgi:EAL and modified HD-GYP domain-containing signal transduction protein
VGKVMVGRQPIFDYQRKVFGYELLFRPAPGAGGDGDAMTAEVIVRAGLDFGLDDLVGPKMAFVNATRAFLTGVRDPGLPPDRVVLEVLETVERDEQTIAGCARLREQGYRLALDDYIFSPGDEPLLEMAEMVKLDVQALSMAQIEGQMELVAPFGVSLVAEKVETYAELKACQDLGFDLFQGYVLSRPETVIGVGLNSGRQTCLRLIEQLCRPDFSARDIESIVASDPALSYRLLRAASLGASAGMRRPVSSVNDGLVILGERKLRSWATLLLIGDSGPVVAEQLIISMVRSRMSELLAHELAPAQHDQAFTVGLVSSLDLLMGVPIEEVLDSLTLTDQLNEAVRHRTGPLGEILAAVLEWEQGRQPSPGLAADPIRLERCYLEALRWATSLCDVYHLVNTPAAVAS